LSLFAPNLRRALSAYLQINDESTGRSWCRQDYRYRVCGHRVSDWKFWARSL